MHSKVTLSKQEVKDSETMDLPGNCSYWIPKTKISTERSLLTKLSATNLPAQTLKKKKLIANMCPSNKNQERLTMGISRVGLSVTDIDSSFCFFPSPRILQDWRRGVLPFLLSL
jgi:hypothetical protein